MGLNSGTDKQPHKRKLPKWLKILELDCLCLVIALNFFAWISSDFCNWYAAKLFPVWVNTYGRLTGLVRGSVGEWMIILLVVALVLAVLLIIPAIVLRTKAIGHRIRQYYMFLVYLILPIALIMTLNCTILYHCTRLTESVRKTAAEQNVNLAKGELPPGYTERDLLRIYGIVVDRCNALAEQMSRDAEGCVVYDEDMWAQSVEYLHAMSKDYPRLGGYYPRTKEIRNSWFLSQQYIAGYYFPFSMESNINRVMYIMNKPYTICHELAHIHGYILEDEANYLAYVACVESGNPMFEYSGYLGVMGYLYDALERYVELGMLRQDEIPKITMEVWEDSVFLTEDAWQQVEKQSVLSTQAVEKATDAFMETSLHMNGVSNGLDSYSDVVLLLLDYYAQ